MAASDHLNPHQFIQLYHGTTESAAYHIDTEGLHANHMGLVYGSETPERAERWARARAQEQGDDPMMITFRAHRDNLTKPMSQRHDWAHHGDIPVHQISDIYQIEPDDDRD